MNLTPEVYEDIDSLNRIRARNRTKLKNLLLKSRDSIIKRFFSKNLLQGLSRNYFLKKNQPESSELNNPAIPLELAKQDIQNTEQNIFKHKQEVIKRLRIAPLIIIAWIIGLTIGDRLHHKPLITLLTVVFLIEVLLSVCFSYFEQSILNKHIGLFLGNIAPFLLLLLSLLVLLLPNIYRRIFKYSRYEDPNESKPL